MNTEEFLIQCSKSPLLKKYAPITEQTLKELDFLRANYTLDDLCNLEQALFFISPAVIKNTEPEYIKQNREEKDTHHAKFIELHDNKVFIKKLRQELRMPFDNKGFKVIKRFLHEPHKSFTNVNFDYLEPAFERWFFSWGKDIKYPSYFDWYDKLKTVSPLVYTAVFKAVVKALKKWKLPWRYFDAIEELIIFNTIIPADSGIIWSQSFSDERINKRPRFSLSFDVDTTKDELIEAIKKDECGVLRNRHKYLMGKVRKKPRDFEGTKQMIALYNKYKKDGKKEKEIFEIIRNTSKFKHLSLSAIRDRIKDN